MNTTTAALKALYDRIPRRHSPDNVKEINTILNEYEDLLIKIEAINKFYEQSMPAFFDELELSRSSIKKSTDNKASKKNKDIFFDEGSGTLKDAVQALIDLYGDGSRTE
jgi:hypothetical protein